MVRKYLNYIVFAGAVLVVIAIAVYYTQHVHSLVEAMRSGDKPAREQAALELVKGEQFIDTISGEPSKTRVKAAESLEFVAADASIVKGTEKDAPDYRANAISQALSMLKDLDKDVRSRAVLTLQHAGASSSGTLGALVAGLKDGDNNVRKGTIAALIAPTGGIGPRADATNGIDVAAAIVGIMKKEAGARGPGGDVLGSALFRTPDSQKRSAELLMAQLTDKDGGVRQGAADALGKVGYLGSVPVLKQSMHTDADPQVRRVAIGALALIADKSCEDALVESVNDTSSDNEARAQAAAGLGRIHTDRALATLIKSLADDDLKLRSAVVAALARAARPDVGGKPDAHVIATLMDAVKGKDDDICRGAAQAMQTLGAAEANPALLAVLKDTARDSGTRVAAVVALGFAGNSAAVDPLVQALHDPDGDVDTAARDSLSSIGPAAIDKLVQVMQTDGAEAYYAAEALANLGEAAVPALRRVAEGRDRTAQHWAAFALGQLSGSGVQSARPILQQLAKSSDDDVQYVATEQLHKLGMR